MASRTHCDHCGRFIAAGHPNGDVQLEWNGIVVELKRTRSPGDICLECLRKAATHGRVIVLEEEADEKERLRSTDSG